MGRSSKRKRSLSSGGAGPSASGHGPNPASNRTSPVHKETFDLPQGDEGGTTIDALPAETLLSVFGHLSSPARQHAACVCRRWREALLDPAFCRHVAPGQCLSEALQLCRSGDTLICAPGMYQETLLVEVPLRLVAEDHWAWERQRDRERSRQRRLEERQKEREQQERQEQATGRQLGRLSAGGAAGSSGGAAGGAASSKRGNAAAAIAVAAGGGAGTGAGGIRGSGSGRVVGGAGGAGGGGGVVPPRGAPLVGGRPAPSVTVIALRPPVAVMNSRCCFVGFEFHTGTAHNEVSICSFGPEGDAARFELCTFSGLTGLRVPYSKGPDTRLELHDCSLIGTTQTLAAVQMDAGRLRMDRCVVQNNSVGVEVGPAALARLARCDVRWCGTALVVDGCLALAHCRLWGNGKLGNVSTDTRVRSAMQESEQQLLAAAAVAVTEGGSAAAAAAAAANPTTRSLLDEAAGLSGSAAESRATDGAAATGAAGCGNKRSAGARTQRAAAAAGAAGAAAGPGPSSAGGPAAAAGALAAVASPTRGARLSARRGASHFSPILAGGAVAAATSTATEPGAGLPAPATHNGAGRGAGGGAVGAGSSRAASREQVEALAAVGWAEVAVAFEARGSLVRVVDCEVAAPQLIMRAGLHKDVRKKARQLVRQVYGALDDESAPEWEVLVASDLDSDADDSADDPDVEDPDAQELEDAEAEDDDMMDEMFEDPLDAADDPELDESGDEEEEGSSDSDGGEEGSSDRDGEGNDGDGCDGEMGAGGAGGGGAGGGAGEEGEGAEEEGAEVGEGEDEDWEGGDESSGGSGRSSSSGGGSSSGSSDGDSTSDEDDEDDD